MVPALQEAAGERLAHPSIILGAKSFFPTKTETEWGAGRGAGGWWWGGGGEGRAHRQRSTRLEKNDRKLERKRTEKDKKTRANEGARRETARVHGAPSPSRPLPLVPSSFRALVTSRTFSNG